MELLVIIDQLSANKLNYKDFTESLNETGLIPESMNPKTSVFDEH